MPTSEKQPYSQLKDDQDRALRSASPAIKRPASDMGAQDREEHNTDVEMGEDSVTGPTSGHSQMDYSQDAKGKQDNGKRLRSVEAPEIILSHPSDPKPISQTAPEDSISTVADSPAPSTSKASTAATSLHEPSVSPEQIPSIDEQVAKVIELMRDQLQDKQKGYVVSGKWLRRVQARSSFPPEGKPVEKSATEGPIGPIDNSDISMVIEDSGNLKDEAGEPYTPLRPGLAIGEDFEILPEEAWNLVVSWYGVARTSPIITRYAHDLSEGEIPMVQYELNPPVWSFLKVPATHTPQTQREKDLPPARLLNTRATPFMKWLKQAKQLVHVDLATKVRVWRVLGGLKSTSVSGILTPAASRSASPAPGVEIFASAGDKMLLDVNTFASLPIGEHRELIDVKDQTNDPNYNGKTTLATLGLGRNDVIVLEEQGTRNEEWPSENVRLSLTKNLQSKSKNLTPSGRSSPAPGIVTRGRSRRDGRPKGMTGLSNLGNTCYMNSALQCIRSVQELTEYFLHQEWKKELNTDNPLGHHGNIAKAYADLLKMIYDDNASSCNPSRFKATIGKYGPSFSGYGQQDSQEFLLFLLDGLQEDLNRIHKKPYIEKPDSTDEMVHDEVALKEFADKNWDIYKARNDSVITDLFAGMYKSTVTCPVCDKVSIIFDPFNNLTLQLPIENNWSKEIFYFPLSKPPFKIDAELDKNATIRNLKEYCAKRSGYDPDKMIMAESYKNKFFRTFNNTETISEAQIGQHDVMCMYELDDVPTNYNPNKKKKMYSTYSTFGKSEEDELVALDSPEADKLLVPVYNRVVKTTTVRSSRQLFAHPSYVVVTRADSASYDRIFKKLLNYAQTLTTKNILDIESAPNSDDGTPDDSDALIMTDEGSGSGSGNPSASSVQGEDDMVDVSMRDPSQPPTGDLPDTEHNVHRVLQPDAPIPLQLSNIFDIRIAATGEAIPTGWNNIDEQKEYISLKSRIPQPLPHRPAHKSGDGAESDDTSADELADIEFEDVKQIPDSNSESGASGANASEDESDGNNLPEVSEIIHHKDTRGLSKHQKKKTYGKVDRRRHNGNKQNRRQNVVAPQPQPQPQPRPQPKSKSTTSKIDSSTTALIRPGEGIILDWEANAYDALFGAGLNEPTDMRGKGTWKDITTLEDKELDAKRQIRNNRKKNGISLDDCLNEFGKTETLSEQNAWYCPRCKEHRRANKTFELWKAPDILVMHLKRFSSNRSFRDKLEVRVDYPVEGLDLSTMVRDQSDGKTLIYDLIAVDNHYGGLGGGHYTAYAKNFLNDNWYDYNDSHVSSKQDPQSVVTSAAYLLFYRRRADYPLGGPNLERFLVEADSDEQVGSREPSPSGEGRRLDDSSHNGSSSAFPAAQVHRVGDGGRALLQNRDPIPDRDLGSPLRLNVSSDDLPTYQQATSRSNDDEMLLDDEGVDMSNPTQIWNQDPGWGWSGLAGLNRGIAGHNSSDVDAESTKGEGASRTSSLRDVDDSFMHSEDVDDFSRRSMRESAPAPDIPAVSIEPPGSDDDSELPVAELRSYEPSGEMQFWQEGK